MPRIVYALPIIREDQSVELDNAFVINTDPKGKVPWKMVMLDPNDPYSKMKIGSSEATYEVLYAAQSNSTDEHIMIYCLFVDEANIKQYVPSNEKYKSFIYTPEDHENRRIALALDGVSESSLDDYCLDKSLQIGVYELPMDSFQIAGCIYSTNTATNQTLYLNPKVDSEKFVKHIRKTWERDENEAEFDALRKEKREFVVLGMTSFKNRMNELREQGKDTNLTIKFE